MLFAERVAGSCRLLAAHVVSLVGEVVEDGVSELKKLTLLACVLGIDWLLQLALECHLACGRPCFASS